MASRAEDWFRQALRDLAHARDTLDDGVYEWAAFAAQQAAEEAVKALFQSLGGEARGHSPLHRSAVPELVSGRRSRRLLYGRRGPAGHRGGAPRDRHVRARLLERLPASVVESLLLSPMDNPFLADLVWWRGDEVFVVEASLQVNGTDVARAAARAATLARTGARAVAMVVGEAWATPDTARQAEALGVEWKVGADWRWLPFVATP